MLMMVLIWMQLKKVEISVKQDDKPAEENLLKILLFSAGIESIGSCTQRYSNVYKKYSCKQIYSKDIHALNHAKILKHI